MIHLEAVEVAGANQAREDEFPFTVPAVASLRGTRLRFPTEVTFLVGENGSGKSTLLEALAAAAGSITVGSEQVERDASLRHIQPLLKALRLSWVRKTRRGFFMRSEDFFGYARRIEQMRDELEVERREIEADTSRSPLVKALTLTPYHSQIGAIEQRYGAGLDSASHGESFLRLFQTRFVPNGLYLMDEPEAPLSPMRQLALLSLIKECVEDSGAQFIIATHSPILMAAPRATIYSFDDGRVRQVAYEETEHFRFTRDFLNQRESFLRHL